MQKIKKQQWSSEEKDLLTVLYSQFSSKKWKKIAESFKEKGLNRTQTECRQKWINFLDPKINKNQWEEWELKKIYQLYQIYGTRWCMVQKFVNRTQNKIKNHFYGTIRNLIRTVLYYFDRKRINFSNYISHIPPSYLASLYNATDSFEWLGNQIKDAIQAMAFKFDKPELVKRIQEKKEIYRKLYQSLEKDSVAEKTINLPQVNEQNHHLSQNPNIEVVEAIYKQGESNHYFNSNFGFNLSYLNMVTYPNFNSGFFIWQP